VSRDSVTRDLVAVLCKKDGFLVDEAETASDARMHLDADPFFACVVDVRPAFSRGPALLRELGATRIDNLVLIAGEGDSETPATVEITGAVAALTRPFEGDAIMRILNGLIVPHGMRSGRAAMLGKEAAGT
jgi:DNA-binding NtrC family response regulator